MAPRKDARVPKIPSPVSPKTTRVARKAFNSNSKRWTAEETEVLRAMRARNPPMPHKEIGRLFKPERSDQACRIKLLKLKEEDQRRAQAAAECISTAEPHTARQMMHGSTTSTSKMFIGQPSQRQNALAPVVSRQLPPLPAYIPPPRSLAPASFRSWGDAQFPVPRWPAGCSSTATTMQMSGSMDWRDVTGVRDQGPAQGGPVRKLYEQP